MELSERLKRIRKDNGYTRERLAQKFGLTTDYVLGIEKPKPAPLPYSAAALELARQFDRLESWRRLGS